MPLKIKKISAQEILDSRGEPTLEVTAELNNGFIASAGVPSGASTGRYEAFELRDGDYHRYGGLGVLKAVSNVNNILHPNLSGLLVTEQAKIDQLMIELDGTANKSNLGANAILGVSLAVAKVAALANNLQLYQYIRQLYNNKLSQYTLPTPVVNVINGGKHGSTNIDLQEFWLIPHQTITFADKLRQASEIFHCLADVLHNVGMDIDLGNEGGYSPEAKSHAQIFELLMRAITRAGFTPGDDILLGIDAGASVFYDELASTYELKLENKKFTAEELADFYEGLMNDYPLRFLEDPFAEEDWSAWQSFTKDDFVVKHKVKLIGDDLFVTNTQRLAKGIKLKAANTILIKPNQIGTLTETLSAIHLAQTNNYQIMISHRSGETIDTTIADLAVAVNADYIKTGSTARGERIAKYNRLLSIEKRLNKF